MLRLATSSLTFDGFENNDYKCLFAHAAQTGYRRVEFNCWYGETLTPSRIRSIKRTMQAEWPGADSTACIRIRRKHFGNPCAECGT